MWLISRVYSYGFDKKLSEIENVDQSFVVKTRKFGMELAFATHQEEPEEKGILDYPSAFKVLRPEHMDFDTEPRWEFRAFATEAGLLLKLADSPAAKELYMADTQGKGNIRDWLASLLLEYLKRLRWARIMRKTASRGSRTTDRLWTFSLRVRMWNR